MSLTPNQLMVLLDCYRGTFNRDRHLGSVNEDQDLLVRCGLIEGASARPRVTDRGRGLVEYLTGERAGEAAAQEEPTPPPSGVYLIWHQEVGKDSRPFLRTGFLAYEDAKRHCLDQVKRRAEQYGTFAHHGTTEKGGVEYYEVLAANWHPETEPKVKYRWTIKHLQFGMPI